MQHLFGAASTLAVHTRPPSSWRRCGVACTLALVAVLVWPVGARADFPVITERFASDPGWVGSNNWSNLDCTGAYQDFGWNSAYGGSIGGAIKRSATTANFQTGLSSEKNLTNSLSFRGTIRLPSSGSSDGVPSVQNGGHMLFGMFNSNTRSWRANNYFMIQVADNAGGRSASVRLELGSTHWRGMATTPLNIEWDQSYNFHATYNPPNGGSNPTGQIVLTIDGVGTEGQYVSETIAADGSIFTRLGYLNFQLPPSPAAGQQTNETLTAYITNLIANDVSYDFSSGASGWSGNGNDVSSGDDCVTKGRQRFGYQTSKHVKPGGSEGEMGGRIWRAEGVPIASYGDALGPAHFTDNLTARGKFVMSDAVTDSNFYFGWYNSASFTGGSDIPSSFVGMSFGGASAEGYGVSPAFHNTNGTSELNHVEGGADGYRGGRRWPAPGVGPSSGPIRVSPDRIVHSFDLTYTAATRQLKLVLDAGTPQEATSTLTVSILDTATFNRFGVITIDRGGEYQRVYFDDLEYSAPA